MTLTDGVAAVGAWHRETFGEHDPAEHRKALDDKLDEELVEYRADRTGEELADLQILLLAIAAREEIDLEAEVIAKFEILKGRDQKARDRERGIAIPGETNSEEPEAILDFGRKIYFETKESAAAFAYLRDKTSIPVERRDTYEGSTGWTYPYRLFVDGLGRHCGIEPCWVIHAAEEEGFSYGS